jgi:hypothetical protein
MKRVLRAFTRGAHQAQIGAINTCRVSYCLEKLGHQDATLACRKKLADEEFRKYSL